MEAAMDLLTEGPQGFWSGIYLGSHIAMLQHHGAWRVYLDQMLQDTSRFETAEEAAGWLRRRVEERAAEAIFPGLARAHAA
jgi:hypothetical protein